MKNQTPWRSDDPVEQARMAVEYMANFYKSKSIESEIYRTLENLLAALELAFGDSIASYLMTQVTDGYKGQEQLKQVLNELGHPPIRFRSGGVTSADLELEALAAYSYTSLAIELNKSSPDITWLPLSEASYHLGTMDGLAFPMITNKAERAQKGGEGKAIKYNDALDKVAALFESEMPEGGWKSPQVAIFALVDKIVALNLNLKKDKRELSDQLQGICDRNARFKKKIRSTLQSTIKRKKG